MSYTMLPGKWNGPMATQRAGICSNCNRDIDGARNNIKLRCPFCGGKVELKEAIISLENGFATVEEIAVPSTYERYK